MQAPSPEVARIAKDWKRIRLTLVSLAKRSFDRRADVEDLAHTAFIRVWTGVTPWQHRWSENPERALFLLMKDERRRELRHGRVVDRLAPSLTYEIEHETDDEPEPFFAALDQRERDHVLQRLKAELEKGSRDALVLEATLEGKDGNKEIAEHLHITEEEAKNARRALVKAGREALAMLGLAGAGEGVLRRVTEADAPAEELTALELAMLEQHRSFTQAMLVDALLARGLSVDDIERRFAALEEAERVRAEETRVAREAEMQRRGEAAAVAAKGQWKGYVVLALVVAAICVGLWVEQCR